MNPVKLVMLGLLSQMPKEDQDKVNEAKAKVEAIMAEYGQCGEMAIAIIAVDLGDK